MFYDKISKLIVLSSFERSGGTYFAEILGTFILVLCIFALVHQKSDRISLVVGLLVGGMLLSTSSTMFANPQVTIARMFTYSNAEVSPVNGIVFIIMELIGAVIAVFIWEKFIKNCLP